MTALAPLAARPLLAAAWMTGTVASFTLMAIAGRRVSADLDTFEIMAYRSVIGFGIVLVAGALAGTLHHVRARRLDLHLGRNLCHFAGQNLWFLALTMIPLAQVFALEFTYPIWVALIAPLVLGEQLTARRLAAALTGFAGILVVVRPGLVAPDPGTLVALLAALGFAGSALFTKRLTRDQGITGILFWMTAMQTVMGFATAAADGTVTLPPPAAWPWVGVIAVCGLSAHFCLTTALSLAPASVVTPMDFARLPVIAAVGAMLYGEAVDPFVLLGGVIILAAISLNLAGSRPPARAVGSQSGR